MSKDNVVGKDLKLRVEINMMKPFTVPLFCINITTQRQNLLEIVPLTMRFNVHKKLRRI